MRLLPLLVLLATASAAQTDPTSVPQADARIAQLEADLQTAQREQGAVHETLRQLALRKDSLDAERAVFQDRIRTYQADAEALATRTAGVRATYDRLVQGPGTPAERLDYEDARAQLAADGDRLAAESRQLNAWQEAINLAYRLHASDVREAVAQGREASRRSWTLATERGRLLELRDRLRRRAGQR